MTHRQEVERWGRFTAGPLTFSVKHELWDGNIQDHADQGVSIAVMADVAGKEIALLQFNCWCRAVHRTLPLCPIWDRDGHKLHFVQ